MRATDLLRDLDGDGYDEDSYSEEEFSEDEYYYRPGEAAAVVPLVSSVSLHRSLERSQELSRSLGYGSEGEPEMEQLLASHPGCMRTGDTVVRIPIYVKRRSESEPPILVLQTDLGPPYPLQPPAMRVVTAAPYIGEQDRADLTHWLTVQAQPKLGQPMLPGLLALAQMWVEIKRDLHLERERQREEDERLALVAQEEAQEAARQEALQAEAREQEAAKEKAEAERQARILAGEEVTESSEDSAMKTRQPHRVRKFHISPGSIPLLKDLCIKVFGDNLLLFEGFEEVPIQIRSKVFRYLIDTHMLSHRKLALLVGPDQLKMDLSSCSRYIKDHYLQVLQRAKSLSRLSVEGCRLLTDEGLSKIANCSRLTDMNLSGTQLTSQGLNSIVSDCPNLVRVNVSQCPIKTGLAALGRRCTKLTYVLANDCRLLDAEDTIRLLNFAGPCLQTFEIRACGADIIREIKPATGRYGVTKTQIQTFNVEFTPLKQPLQALVTLNMSNCYFLTDSFATKFFTSPMPALQQLHYESSPLSSAGVLHVLARCSGLRSFSATDWTSVHREQQLANFDAFLQTAVRGQRLQEASIGRQKLLTFERLAPLVRIDSLHTLSLSAIDREFTLFKLVKLLLPMKSLKVLHLSDIAVDKGAKLPNFIDGFARLETVRFEVMPDLGDDEFNNGLLRVMSNVRSLSLWGLMQLTSDGLLAIVNSLNVLSFLSISRSTGLAFPLSILLDSQHKAPIAALDLPHYRLGQLFTDHSLNSILDESRTPNSKIKTLKITCMLGNYMAVAHRQVFQAMFFLLPFLEHLDLTHQFSVAGIADTTLPNNTLKSLRYCHRHDTAFILNVAPGCEKKTFDCAPHMDKGENDGDFESSDELFDMAALFD